MHNYSSGYKLLAAAFILGAIGILISLIFSSCKTLEKKTEKAYTGVASYDPLTPKDSANFYKRAKTMIKPTPIKTIPGKTIRVPYPVEKIKKVLDSATAQRLIDSLNKAHTAADNYNDEDCTRQVNEALKTGYQQAKFEDYINGRDSVTPEVQYVPDPSTISLLDEANLNLRNAQAELQKTTAQRDIYKGEANTRFWWLLILGVLLGLSGYFLIRKSTSVTSIFNKIKSSV